ncbi:MAG: Gfo/Idh/MocA family oxidoreductase [Promethearchaeota archaeon]|jgi:predicted dehydrogenase
MKLPITAILLGAGNRGLTMYGEYGLRNPTRLKFLAVAEPIDARREKFAQLHRIPPDMCYKSWEELLEQNKFADISIISTQDQQHVNPTLTALEKGYDVLLEKPMANTLEGCVKIVKKVEETGRILGIAHVLRYTTFFSTIQNLIQEGLLGDITNISHRENVSWYHMAHSFVRGNWGNVEKSSPMILAKCCHDLDLLFWLIGSLPKKISSFGSLMHFNKQNSPKDAPDYCVMGCPISNSCLYYAPRIYINIIPIIHEIRKSNIKLYKILANLRQNHKKFLKFLSKFIRPLKRLMEYREWPVEPIYSGRVEEKSGDYSDKTKLNILRTSPYGRCVYHCDNDVVDHQVVNIEFENGTTANLTMHGFSEREGRTLRIDGTKATLIGLFYRGGEKIMLYDHFSGIEKTIYSQKFSSKTTNHGGGDFRFISAYLNSISINGNSQPLTNAKGTLESHLMAFAANESRLKGSVVDMEEYRKKADHL